MWQAPGTGTLLTAAASAPIYSGDACGSACGTCYKLTNQGYGPVANSGASPAFKGDTVVVMITNLCPAADNQEWCSSPNRYNYDQHFDMGSDGNSPNGWGNVVVAYERVDCASAAQSLVGDYKGQCDCAAGKTSRVRRGLEWLV